MKIKIIFLGLMLVIYFNNLQAQEKVQLLPSAQKELVEKLPLYNFFFLSKYLDNDFLSVEQKNAVNAQFINLIGSDHLKYLDSLDASAFPKLKKYLNFLNIKSPARAEFKHYFNKEDSTTFKEKYPKKLKDEKLLISIQNVKGEIKILEKEKSNLFSEFSNLKDKINNLYIQDTKQKDSLQKSLTHQEEVFNDKILKINKNIAAKSKAIEDDIDKYSLQYFNEHPDTNQRIINVDYISAYYTDKKVEKTLQFTNNYVQSIQSQGTSSFKLPSESQLIDAMAIFLANRAKQEAAIWFMDQLRTRLKNPLVKDAFPQTIKLISSLEDYKVPNFGAEWRYAVSSDFIMMPEHIVGSEWMKVMVDGPELKNIKTAIEFGSKLNRLMAENYNYRDIIQTLYLDKLEKGNIYKEGETFQPYIDNSVTMLYLMTNELYSIDHLSNTPTYRLLNFEELNSLNKNQWDYLVELVHLKYFYNTGIISPDTLKKIKDNKQKSNVYLSKVLLSLSQFDKIRKDLEKLNGDEKKDFSKQNYNSAWKLINQILVNLDATDFIIEKSDSLNIKKLKTSIEIYENIQSRDFRAAIQNTLSLIDEFNNYNAQKINIKDNEVYSFVINNQKLLIHKKNESVELNIINPNIINLKKDSLQINPSNRFYVKLKYDNLSLKRLNVFSAEHPDKKFLSDVVTSGDYSKLLKKLKLTSNELLKYLPPVKTQNSNVKQTMFSDKEKEVVKYQAPLNEMYSAQLLKLASFFGDVLSATNSDQLADVISSHALPPTSYKLKRKVKSSIDFNAYVGAYGGYKLASANSTYIDGWTGGITAPIGITYTRSFGNNGNGTFGISFNFIDLGNIVNHYLTSSEKYYKDVHFSEVFSPNVNLLYSIKNTPLVAFVGGSFLPMKNIIVDGSAKNNRAFDVSIIQVGLKIDIPLINLWTNQKE